MRAVKRETFRPRLRPWVFALVAIVAVLASFAPATYYLGSWQPGTYEHRILIPRAKIGAAVNCYREVRREAWRCDVYEATPAQTMIDNLKAQVKP